MARPSVRKGHPALDARRGRGQVPALLVEGPALAVGEDDERDLHPGGIAVRLAEEVREDHVVAVGIAAEVEDDAFGRGQVLDSGADVQPGRAAQIDVEDAVFERVDGGVGWRDGDGGLGDAAERDLERLRGRGRASPATSTRPARVRTGPSNGSASTGANPRGILRASRRRMSRASRPSIGENDVAALNASSREARTTAWPRSTPTAKGAGRASAARRDRRRRGRRRGRATRQERVRRRSSSVRPARARFEGTGKDRVPVDLDHVEIGVEVLEDVPGDDDVGQAHALRSYR